MKRSFSSGVPIDTRRVFSFAGHIDTSRVSTPCSRKRACTSAGVPSLSRKRMKFVTDGWTSIVSISRSARATRSRSRSHSSTRDRMTPTSRAIFTATAWVSAPTFEGSCTARKTSARSECMMRIPTRRPAEASTFEKVLLMIMFGCPARSGRSVRRAKSLYASSTSTSVSGYAFATARITSKSISLPVGLFGVVKTTTSGLARFIAPSARSRDFVRPADAFVDDGAAGDRRETLVHRVRRLEEEHPAPVPAEHEERLQQRVVAAIAEHELVGRDAVVAREDRTEVERRAG